MHEYNRYNSIIEHNIVNGNQSASVAETIFPLTPTYDIYIVIYICVCVCVCVCVCACVRACVRA